MIDRYSVSAKNHRKAGRQVIIHARSKVFHNTEFGKNVAIQGLIKIPEGRPLHGRVRVGRSAPQHKMTVVKKICRVLRVEGVSLKAIKRL